MSNPKLVWFRNDLRIRDHHALYQAATEGLQSGVIAVASITPEQWLKQDEAKCKVQFWISCLRSLKEDLATLNIPLLVVYAANNQQLPEQLIDICRRYSVSDVFFNNEYPAYEQQRDLAVEQRLNAGGIRCHRFDSDLILAVGTVVNQQSEPYRVFTPFARAWRQKYVQVMPDLLPAPQAVTPLAITGDPVPDGQGYGVSRGADWQATLWPAGSEAAHQRLESFVERKVDLYPQQRDVPSADSTSTLSPYLSVGAISARQCLAAMRCYSEDPDWFENQWVTELIWREFYRHLIVLYPEMNRWQPFKPEIEERLSWEFDPVLFDAWCNGETGFPIVDAGMKQLLETGWMHNRVRMITASFLTKLLRHDWRLGARFFMQHLIDGDFASNLGGWQWSASVGADAAPYFRIFNPQRQTERFDPQGRYIAEWLPASAVGAKQAEIAGLASTQVRPGPIIDYSKQRQISLDLYQSSGVTVEPL